MPRKYKVKKRTHEIQQAIINVLTEPMPLRAIALKTSLDKANIAYHLKKMAHDDVIVKTHIKGAPSDEAFLYSLGEVEVRSYAEPKKKNKLLTLEDLIEKERREYKPKGAMAKVDDAFGKLVNTSKLAHQDRVTALRNTRIGCGISQVYSIG
jgi:DNA-binding transcriptional regulator GbsR (MarR family)